MFVDWKKSFLYVLINRLNFAPHKFLFLLKNYLMPNVVGTSAKAWNRNGLIINQIAVYLHRFKYKSDWNNFLIQFAHCMSHETIHSLMDYPAKPGEEKMVRLMDTHAFQVTFE